MKFKSREFKLSQVICLILYYGFAQYLPVSNTYFNIGGHIRYFLCKRIFKKCGKQVNIERKAYFATGVDIEIGDYSGIGINAHIPNGTVIGNYVMMGPNCFILDVNHNVTDISKPMCKQGSTEKKITRIGNDVWIGRDVHMTSGRTIADGTIVAMASVLTKDFPEYSVVGGNPAKLIKNRKYEKDSSVNRG